MTEETNTSLFAELDGTFFAQQGRYFSSRTAKNNASIPFKDHPQIIILIDILSRKNNHHVILHNNFQQRLHYFFIEAFLHHLTYENIPSHFFDGKLIYLDVENLFFTNAQQLAIAKDFETLYSFLKNSEKYLLIALSRLDPLLKDNEQNNAFLSRQFELLLNHPKCRFLVFSNENNTSSSCLEKYFNYLSLGPATEMDIAAILKHQRIELENYHHVLIPEEILLQAYTLSERYLSTHHTLAKTLELLDSSAARAAMIEKGEYAGQTKPIVTINILTSVLSSWTQIPASYLLPNKFKLGEFTQGLQQRIFGQDAAISILARALQQAQARLQHTHGPFCSLLFAGPDHTGKKTTAIAIAEQLFKQLNVLYFAQSVAGTLNTLLDLKLKRCTDKQYFKLTDVISTAPYSIIVFEHIEQASSIILEELYRIAHTGFLYDEGGNQYDFHQSIIILNARTATEHLIDLSPVVTDEQGDVDLMQLVMNEQKYSAAATYQHSPQDLADITAREIKKSLPQALCEQFHIVPFLPLNKSAIEKIIHQKIKMLAKLLDSRYGIELSYALEVIRYLTNEVLLQKHENNAIDTEKGLKQLYFVVEQAILNLADNKQRPLQLFLQLNETGQSLRCDWSFAPARQHAT